jgi:hypothetical protein
MIAKIAAGLIAAVAVTAGGLYFSGYDFGMSHTCPNSGKCVMPVSEGKSCCLAAPSCCSADKTVNAEALAAFTGTMAVSTSITPAIGCCDE